MPGSKNVIISAKCAPKRAILSDVRKAGLEAVELFLSKEIMADLGEIIGVCRDFPLRYSVHAPNDDFNPGKLSELVNAINAEKVVFHDIFWESEWEEIIGVFKNTRARLCIENVANIHEPLKFMRKYGLGRCLDLEHLQMECRGFFEEEFVNVMKQASYVHLTGYTFGSKLWHTHIHESAEHNLYVLNLLAKAGYSGPVVSEARLSLQTYEQFKKLNDFYAMWRAQVEKQ